MICKNCGASLDDGVKFCTVCGTALAAESVQQVEPQPASSVEPQPVYYAQPQPEVKKSVTKEELPSQYKPLGAWMYFLLQILFALPIVGFVFLIIYSFDDSNINRRNFARSYWCSLLVTVAVVLLILIIVIIAGASLVPLMRGY